MEEGASERRRLSDRRHRNSVSGAEVQAGREDRRAAAGAEADVAGGCPRRVDGRGPAGSGAEEPQRRPGRPDGIAVPPDRPGDRKSVVERKVVSVRVAPGGRRYIQKKKKKKAKE